MGYPGIFLCGISRYYLVQVGISRDTSALISGISRDIPVLVFLERVIPGYPHVCMLKKINTPFADGALRLQVGVGLTPRRQRLFCSGTLSVCQGRQGYGGQFSPSTGQRSGLYVYPVGVAPVLTRSGPQVTIPGYPGLSQFIW